MKAPVYTNGHGRFHVVYSSRGDVIRYLDVYCCGEEEDDKAFPRFTSTIQWLLDIELGRIKRVYRLPVALATSLSRLLTEHGLHVDI